MQGVVRSRFQQLAFTHAAMTAGDAAMVVALADSFFFDVDPVGARGRVLGFLLVSFTPFLVIAPLVGPAIDRVRGGRRFVVRAVAGSRIALSVLMVLYVDDVALFPLVFVALVLQKTYSVSKSALVPAVVRNDRELVEANSKLGVIAGLAGAVSATVAAGLQVLFGAAAALSQGAALFGVALVLSFGLSRDRTVAADRGSLDDVRVLPPAVRTAGVAVLVLRSVSGFMLFHLAFVFRGLPNDERLFAIAMVCASLGTLSANASAPRIRRHLGVEQMISVALALPALAGLTAAMFGGPVAGIGVVAVVNFCVAVARLSFESTVQSEGPAADRGRTFARFETRFQLGWVASAVIPVAVAIPAGAGNAVVGLVAVSTFVSYRSGLGGRTRRVRRR